jgi:hypothetical protein
MVTIHLKSGVTKFLEVNTQKYILPCLKASAYKSLGVLSQKHNLQLPLILIGCPVLLDLPTTTSASTSISTS